VLGYKSSHDAHATNIFCSEVDDIGISDTGLPTPIRIPGVPAPDSLEVQSSTWDEMVAKDSSFYSTGFIVGSILVLVASLAIAIWLYMRYKRKV